MRRDMKEVKTWLPNAMSKRRVTWSKIDKVCISTFVSPVSVNAETLLKRASMKGRGIEPMRFGDIHIEREATREKNKK